MTRLPSNVGRIVIITDMLLGGGRERRIVQLITGLNRLGVSEITLILLDDLIDYPEIFELDVRVVIIKRKNNRDFSVFPKLYRLLKSLGPCIVNPWSYMSTFYSAPICSLLGLPCIGAFVVDAKPSRRFSINWISMKIGFKLCQTIIGNSLAGHNAYKTPQSKRVVIYNGFDGSRIRKSLPTKACSNAIQIAMIGRLDKQKDYRTYVDALAILKARNINFQSYIVGQGADHDALKAYADLLCGDRVKFTGFMRDIDEFISRINIGVLCTDPEHHAEGISNALMEMMAQGKAVVATNGGGTPEIVSNGYNGFLIPPRDPKALADKLQQLCDDPKLLEALGTNAAKTVSTKFSLDRMTQEFWQTYNEQL